MDDADYGHRQIPPRELPTIRGVNSLPQTSGGAQNSLSGRPRAEPAPGHVIQESKRPPNEFVKRHIFKRECNAYIENPRTQKCFCNREREWHQQNNTQEVQDATWSSEEHTVLKATDAFGKIKFHGFGRLRAGEKAKYIRVDALLQEYEWIWNLLVNENLWSAPVPEIVLSINGGARKMEESAIKQRLKVALKKGLMNVVTSARTWFITPGFHVGVGKLVGESVREYSLAASNDSSFVTIGIGTWGAVYNRDQLVNSPDGTEDSDDCYVAHYYNCVEYPGKGQGVLDPHHSHFILCDDGSEKSYNREIDFRTNFEDFITQRATNTSDGSPVVQVVIDGGEKTLLTAYSGLVKGTPVVVIQGSGRCADLISEVVGTTDESTPKESVRKKAEDLLNVLREKWDLTDNEFQEYTNQLVAMCQNYRHLIHIFNLNSANKELDHTILLAVLKSPKLQDPQAQLSLAMNLNRWDLAAQEIFTEDNIGQWKHLDLNKPMLMALNKGQTKFIELFLDHGISIEKFLTAKGLSELYRMALAVKYITREGEELREIIENTKIPGSSYDFTFDSASDSANLLFAIGIVVQKFTGGTMPNMYDNRETGQPYVYEVPQEVEVVNITACGPKADAKNQELNSRQDDQTGEPSVSAVRHKPKKRKIVYPVYPPRSMSGERLYTEQDLFIWAVLLNRMDLAKVFWRMGRDHIGSALIACAIFHQFHLRARDDGEMALAASLKRNSEYFEAIATGILSVAYEEDKDRTHLLLIRGLPYYGNETAMSLADQNECMDFMSHTAVQTKLNRIWMGGMSPYVPIWKIWVNIFLSFICIRLIFPIRNFKLKTNVQWKPKADQDSRNHTTNRVGPVLDKRHMLNAEYVDENAPNARELRETVAAQEATVSMDAKSRETYLDQFRWRQQHGWKRVGYLKAIRIFYSAPITKFILNSISYIIFLLLMSYVVMVELKEFVKVGTTNGTCIGDHLSGYCIPVVELIVAIWVVTLIIEECRQAFMRGQRSFRYKLKIWFSSDWNKFDLLLYTLFISAIFMRFLLDNKYFVGIRCIYAFILSMFYLRFMQTYYAHPVMGPKVVMIRKMVNDIFFFVVIFLIFFLAYGTAAQALLYPNHELNSELLKKIVYYPYWQVFTNLELDVVEGKRPGQTPNALVIVFFVLYMLLTNILLLNLLIAMFGYTFSKVQGSSMKIWAYNRYDLILEYFDRPGIPPPFIVFPIIYRLFTYLVELCRRNCCRINPPKTKSDFKVILDAHENRMLSAFEHHCMERLMAAMDNDEPVHDQETHPTVESENRHVNHSINTIADEITILKEIIERKSRPEGASGESQLESAIADRREADENYKELRERYRNLENMMTKQANALENISQALEGIAKSKM